MTRNDYDEMSLSDLIDKAQDRETGISGYHVFTGWLESYYDPAKSALIDSLTEFGS